MQTGSLEMVNGEFTNEVNNTIILSNDDSLMVETEFKVNDQPT